jgi:hypothetical protein
LRSPLLGLLLLTVFAGFAHDVQRQISLHKTPTVSGLLRQRDRKEILVWWADILWGFWNGLTAWIVLIVHVFGGWENFPFYNEARSGNWYDFGFLLGTGSPLLGAIGGRGRRGR